MIHEHIVLNILLCKMSFSHEEIKDLPDKSFQPQHYSFPLVPLARLNLKEGFFKYLSFIISHGFIVMQLMILLLLSLLQKSKREKDGLARLSEASFLVKGFTIGRMLLKFWLNMKAVTSTKQSLKH